jgi:DNA-binding GntR family transcriptional regulator
MSASGEGCCRQDLVHGLHAPGKRLKIAELVERYDCGPGAVREVLQQLSGEGWVEIEPNRGASVRKIALKSLEDMYEVRQYLEVLTSRRFVENASNRDIKQLELIQQEFDQAAEQSDHSGCSNANQKFHDSINTIAGNDEALTTIRRLGRMMHAIRQSVGFSKDRLETVSREHHQLLAAFRERDADQAEQIMLTHLTGAADDLITRYRDSSMAV